MPGWLDTGDEGFIHQGELYVSGRTKDIILAYIVGSIVLAIGLSVATAVWGGLAAALLLLVAPGSLVIWVFVISFGFSYAARDVVYPLIINHCFGVRYMAQIYGALMLGLLPGGALGPIFAATIHDQFGSYAHAFQTFACLNLVAVLTLCFLRNEREPSAAGGQPLAT